MNITIMKRFWILIASAALMSTVSCTETDPEGNGGNGGKEDKNPDVPETAAFKIEGSVLAFRSPSLDENGAGNFSEGDKNTVFFSDAKGSLKTAMQYTYGSSCLWNDLELANKEEVTVTACWPELSASDKDGLMSEAASFVWNASTGKGKADLLLAAPAKAVAGETENIKLSFFHKLHKFVVELSIAQGEKITPEELASAEIKLSGVLPEIPVTLASSSLGNAKGTPAEFSETGGRAWFIIPPQPAGEMAVTVTFAGKKSTIKISECSIDGKPVESLESAKTFTLKIAVSKEKPFTIVGQAISGWESQGSADGSIEL